MLKKVFILPSLTKFERKRGTSIHLVISCVQINYSQITFQYNNNIINGGSKINYGSTNGHIAL